jgi:hypothetical protein
MDLTDWHARFSALRLRSIRALSQRHHASASLDG